MPTALQSGHAHYYWRGRYKSCSQGNFKFVPIDPFYVTQYGWNGCTYRYIPLSSWLGWPWITVHSLTKTTKCFFFLIALVIVFKKAKKGYASESPLGLKTQKLITHDPISISFGNHYCKYSFLLTFIARVRVNRFSIIIIYTIKARLWRSHDDVTNLNVNT